MRTTDSKDKFYIVYPVDSDFLNHNKEYASDDIVKMHIGEETVNAVMIEADNYQQYLELRRMFDAEAKRKERATRCKIPDGKGGLKTCYGSCRNCPLARTGNAISTANLEEDYGFEVPDTSSNNPEDIVITKITIESLKGKAAKLGEIEEKISEMLFQDPKTPDSEMMEKTGFEKQSSFSYHKTKVIESWREEIKNWQ